jgi:acyl-coenzyme A synthetase/AMP-(fatty) acid ligase
MRNFIICTHLQILLGKSSQGECGKQGMWHAWERREKYIRFWWESPKERYHSEDQGVVERIGSEWILGRLAGGVDFIQLAQDRN